MVQKIDAVENFSEFPRKQLFKESFFVKLQPLASKRGVLKIFAGFTGKHLCWSPLNKVAGRPTGNASVFRLRALLKKRHHWATTSLCFCLTGGTEVSSNNIFSAAEVSGVLLCTGRIRCSKKIRKFQRPVKFAKF